MLRALGLSPVRVVGGLALEQLFVMAIGVVLGAILGAGVAVFLLLSGAFVAERAATLQEGVRLAAEALDSGRAQQKLERWIQQSNA